MKKNTNTLLRKVNILDEQGKSDEIIALLTDKRLKKESDKKKSAELYIWRGNTWYNKKEYAKAIADYTKAIEINPISEIALYNRGIAWTAVEEYGNAIADYDNVIKINPKSASAYLNKASILRINKDYDKAILGYDEAIKIDSEYADAYYNRGLAKKENNVNLEESKKDFERYLELTIDENNIWSNYAKYYIEELNERINDKELSIIADLVTKIKEILLINGDCITHYSSLSAIKSLIFDQSKFRISEGNFMNDPSEGTEFFNFLKYEFRTSCNNGSYSETFSPKPFIGSFVTKDKNNDLNMWRFYGKENGVEANGCSITLHTQTFIKAICSSLLKGEEDFLKYKSDINFYRVTYLEHASTNFYIPNSERKEELTELMTELKEKVINYKVKNKTSLEKYLNSIAFLFKSDAYKNENEVRLVVTGIEFEKKYNMTANPPRVYIELEPIKKIVEQITLGPKVDKVNEWASAFHYSYEEKTPEIIISHLPYK